MGLVEPQTDEPPQQAVDSTQDELERALGGWRVEWVQAGSVAQQGYGSPAELSLDEYSAVLALAGLVGLDARLQPAACLDDWPELRLRVEMVVQRRQEGDRWWASRAWPLALPSPLDVPLPLDAASAAGYG